MTVALIALLSAWFCLSVVNQFRRCPFEWSRRFFKVLDRADALSLLPEYSFFAPIPLSFDYELLYRDRLLDGSVTTWHATVFHAQTPWRPLWNPSKRRYEIATDLCSKLTREVRWQLTGARAPHALYVSAEYVALAQYVAGASHSVASRETQFAVAVSPGFDAMRAPAVVFVSPFFAL